MDLTDALALARLAIAQAEDRLAAMPAGATPADLTRLLGTATRERAELLARLPLPFALHMLAADGQVVDLAPGSRPHGDPRQQHAHPLPADTAAGRWTVGLTQGESGARIVPLVQPTAPNPLGVVAFAADFDHAALQRRFEAFAVPGGGAALFRIEPDGATTLLARAPFSESELGQSVKGPLAQGLARAPAGRFEALTQLDEVHRLVAYRRLEGDADRLVVAYGLSRDAALAAWRAQLPTAIALILLLSAAMLWGGWRLDRAWKDRARAGAALAEGEQRLRVLTENLPDVVVRLDRAGRHLYANAAVERATGLPPQAFIGKTHAELGLPADRAAPWVDSLQRVLASSRPERLEFDFPAPDGLRHWESLIVPEPVRPGGEATVLVISRDITERRQAEDQRSEMGRRLADVLESMSDGFVSLDRQWRYVALNAKGAQLLGRDAASLIGRHIWTEFPEGVGQPFHRAYVQAMDERVTVVIEDHYAPWDRWFENRIHPTADGIAIFFTDITERRRAQQALQLSEQRLRDAQHLASLGSWTLDMPSGVLEWSDETYRIFELDPARTQPSYERFLAGIHPEDRDAVDQAWQRAVADRVDYAAAHRLLMPDGRIKHVQERGRCSYADDGTPLQAHGTVQDVTARVQAEQALRASEASHREMFDSNPHPMWVYDLETLAFLAVNDAAVRHYGYTRDEFLRMTIKDIRPPEDVPRLPANVRAVDQGHDDAGTWRHCARDGRLLEVEISSHTLDFGGRPAEMVLAHDVTRRNDVERALRDSEQRLRLALQAANQGLYDLDLRSGDAVVSPEYARMLGYEPEDFRETNAAWRERLHPDDRAAVERAYEDYVAGRSVDYRVEFRQRTRSGSWKWLLSVGRIQARAADGTPLRMLGTHTDLDPIKAAQAAELAATRRFEALFDAAPEAISVSDLDSGRFLLVNDAFVELFGHARDQVIDRSAADLQLWDQAPAREEVVQRLRNGESVQGLEGVARRSDGQPIDVLFSAERIESGGREAMLLMLRDISERKRLEAARRASEARLAYLLAQAPTVIYTARAKGDFAATYFSPNTSKMLGWHAQDFLDQGSFWQDHLHPDDRDGVLLAMHGLETQDELLLEYRFRHADGRWRWMRDQIQVQRDADGGPIELVGAWIDITERKEAEDQARHLAAELEQRVHERTVQLARSEARYRAIFETVPVSIGEEDWSGVQRLLRELRDQGVEDGAAYFATRPDFVQACLQAVRVQRMNRKALALHDIDAPPAPDLVKFFPGPDDLAQFVGELEALWSGQRQYTAKRFLPSSTGRPLSLMVTMSLPGLDDADGTALVCLVDITEIDRLNAELDRSVARLREVNRELQTFTYSVSHDLKAPLRGIDGYSRLLLAEHADRLDDEGRQFLGHIRQATQHMGVLIDDLLAYSRLERRELALAALPLGPAVDAALAGLRASLDAAGARLELAVDPALRVRADAQGLTMALRNLLDNALKFSRQRTPPHIRVAATRTQDGVALSVTDNGVGFDMKFHERIFAIFQRLHRAEDYPGTGVGLAIVRKAVERMGGRVWANSQPDQGACFTIELPEADAP